MTSEEKGLLDRKLAEEKKAKDLMVLGLAGLTDIADFFVMATGASERHVRTVAETVEAGDEGTGDAACFR